MELLELTQKIDHLHRSAISFIGVEKTIEELGKVLGEANDIYVKEYINKCLKRKLKKENSGERTYEKTILPHPTLSEVKIQQLEETIIILETAFLGTNKDEEKYMKNGKVRIPYRRDERNPVALDKYLDQ